MEPRHYLKGSVKRYVFNNGGEVLNVDLLKSEIEALPANEAGYIKLKLSQRREVDKFGNTHSIELNTFVPDKTLVKKPIAPTRAANSSGEKQKASKASFPWE